jgi:hypothetical protein
MVYDLIFYVSPEKEKLKRSYIQGCGKTLYSVPRQTSESIKKLTVE